MRKWILILLIVWGVYYFWPKAPSIKNVNNPYTAIVAFGDSLTAGYGAPKEASYPEQLSCRIGQPVINLGLSGETAAHAPSRIAQVLELRPYMVLIEFGGNDAMHGGTADGAAEAVSKIVDAVQQSGAIAVIVDTGAPTMGAYTRAYKKIAKEKGALFVPGILTGIFNKPQYKSDMVHPNAAGYELVAQRVHKIIKKYLKK